MLSAAQGWSDRDPALTAERGRSQSRMTDTLALKSGTMPAEEARILLPK